MSAACKISALVLAAGRSRRMGGPNKLLAPIDGVPLIRQVVEQTQASGVAEVLVVTGHDEARVRAALAGLAIGFAHNPDFELGLASSLRAGLRVLAARADAVIVCLGDMPRVRSAHIAGLIRAFAAGPGGEICVPFHQGRRGNPVLWPARCFDELQQLQGDVGGRALLEREASALRRVELEDDGVLVDIDSPQALAELARTRG